MKSGVSKWLFDGKPIEDAATVTLLRMLRSDMSLIQKIREARSTAGSEAEPRPMGQSGCKEGEGLTVRREE